MSLETPVSAAAPPTPAAPDWIHSIIPESWNDTMFRDVPVWQWAGIAICVVSAFVAGWLAVRVARWLIRALLVKTGRRIREGHLRTFTAPVGIVIAVGLLFLSVELSGLRLGVAQFFDRMIIAMMTLAVAWVLIRILDVFMRDTETRLLDLQRIEAAAAMPLLRRGLKALLGALALVMVLQNLGYDVTGLLAGLGIGGIAVALAAQKTLANLLGGVSLLSDQPIRVGDYCRFGDKQGTIEEIGLRSTRIRTLDRTVISVPNSEFSEIQLENYAKRDQIRIYTVLGLRYETSPDQMRKILESIRQAIQDNPQLDSENPRVRFVGFGSSSLNVEIQCYACTENFFEYTAIREEFFLEMMDLVANAGSGFAFPSQTLYMAKDSGLPVESS